MLLTVAFGCALSITQTYRQKTEQSRIIAFNSTFLRILQTWIREDTWKTGRRISRGLYFWQCVWPLPLHKKREVHCLLNIMIFHFKVPYVYCKELPHGQWRNLCSTFSIRLSDFIDGYNLEYNIDGIIDFIIHQIFSFARDWSEQVTWPNILQLKLGNIRDLYTTQVNSTLRALWLASSDVISQVLFTSEQRKKDKMAFVAIFSQIKLLFGAASNSACVVYTKTIIHLSFGESGGYLPPLRWIIVKYYPILKLRALRKSLKDNKHNSLHLRRKYAMMFVPRHYPFLVAHSVPSSYSLRKLFISRKR